MTWLHSCSIILFAWPQHLHPSCQNLFASLKYAPLFPKNSTSSPWAKRIQSLFLRPGKHTIFNWIISWSESYIAVPPEAGSQKKTFPNKYWIINRGQSCPPWKSLSLRAQQLHWPGHHGRNSWVNRLTREFCRCEYPACTVPLKVHTSRCPGTCLDSQDSH